MSGGGAGPEPGGVRSRGVPEPGGVRPGAGPEPGGVRPRGGAAPPSGSEVSSLHMADFWHSLFVFQISNVKQNAK